MFYDFSTNLFFVIIIISLRILAQVIIAFQLFTLIFIYSSKNMVESVQCFGRKKTTVAITHYKHSNGLIEIDGVAIEIVQPEMLRYKACEPILLLGRHCFACLDV